MSKCYVPLEEYQRVVEKFPGKKEAIDSFIEAIGERGIDKEESIPCHSINNENILFKIEVPLGIEEESKEENKENEELFKVYNLIIESLKNYVEIEEKYYPLVAVWIIGTYYHRDFPTYPYLYFNAMKGSGKSRLMRLVTYLSKDGSMLNSLTDAVLFRTTGTLGIDEFESVDKKGKETLKELLNSAYKKGIKVKRMRKVKSKDGESQEVEEFDVYRPIVMANIAGINDVLSDRCLSLVLEKSSNPKIIKKVEIYENDTKIQKIKEFPFESCRECSVDAAVEVYKEWNDYVDRVYNTNYTNYTGVQHYTNDTLFSEVIKSEIDGRSLELTIPLLFLAKEINSGVFRKIIDLFQEMISEKKKEDIVESLDISLIDFISQMPLSKWISLSDFFRDFQNSVQLNEEWFNTKWMGKALKRLGLLKDKKRMNYGVLVILDIDKAQEKIKMFR